MVCSKLVRNFYKNLIKFFSFFKLTTMKIFDYKEIFFLSYVAKSISLFSYKRLKKDTFAAKLIAIFYLETWNYKDNQE